MSNRKDELEESLRVAGNKCTRVKITILPPEKDPIEYDVYVIGEPLVVLQLMDYWQNGSPHPLIAFDSSTGDKYFRKLEEYMQISSAFGKYSTFKIIGELSAHEIGI